MKTKLSKLATKADIKHLEKEIAILKNKISITKSLKTTKEINKILNDLTHFMEIMKLEYPFVYNRLERVEDKLGLPHTLLKSPTK